MQKNNIKNPSWQKVKLGDIAYINKHSIGKHYQYKEINYIDISSVGAGVLNNKTRYYIKEAPGRARRLVQDGDTIMSTVRPNRRLFLYMNKPEPNLVVSTGFAVISPKVEVDKRFLYYLLTRDFFIQYLSSNVKGSTYPAVGIDVFENAEFTVPIDYKEQSRIAFILSAFDDKIELNNKINIILEKMAQAIFKEWFIKNEKFKMKNGKLEEISGFGKVITGKTPSTKDSENFNGNYPFITIPDMQNIFITNTERSLSNKAKEKMKNLILPAGSICVSCIATVGKVGITIQSSFTNQQINSVIPKKDIYLPYLYFKLKNMKKDLELYGSGGTATLIIKKSQFEKIQIAKPPEELIEEYYNFVNPILEKIKANIFENISLANLRDLLLPKLMKGEITI